MDDVGPPIAYLLLEEGTPVLASDGTRVGTVQHVLADPEADIFDGIVIDAERGGRGRRFVDAPEVAEIHERGVVLVLDAAAAERLPEMGENPATVRAHPDDAAESDLQRKLRRAWERISGNV